MMEKILQNFNDTKVATTLGLQLVTTISRSQRMVCLCLRWTDNKMVAKFNDTKVATTLGPLLVTIISCSQLMVCLNWPDKKWL